MKVNLIIVLVFALVHSCWPDEVRIVKNGEKKRDAALTATTKKPNDGKLEDGPASVASEKAEIVRQFFEFEGISADVDEQTLARYEPQVVEKMSDLLKKKSNFVLVFRLNSDLNSLIYELLGKQVSDSEERTLQALDLMVPNSESQPTFALAKEDLRKFCQEQPAQCAELLDRLKTRLEGRELHTLDAMVFLEGFYFNWVPLGRLSKYIKDFGQASE